MKKKLMLILAAALGVILVAYLAWGRTYITRHFHVVEVSESALTALAPVDLPGRTLTVYFTRVGNTAFEPDVSAVSSASLMTDGGRLIGNSELLAKMINSAAGGDIYAIATAKKYSSAYSDTVREASDELRSDALPELAGDMPEPEAYDRAVLVLPLWWGGIPKAVESFARESGLDRCPEVYLAVSHGGGGTGACVRDLEALGVNVREPVLEVFDRDTYKAGEAVSEWLASLK